MLPLVLEFRKYKEFDTKICFSGQHNELAKSVFEDFEILPNFSCDGIKKGMTLQKITAEILNYFDVLFEAEKPDMVLVHGDTTTAFCASLSAFYQDIRIAHVEAGLRTFDVKSPFPEEFNRVAIDCVSSIHFAPTESAAENLRKEGRKSVFTVGNTVIDALEYSLSNKTCCPFFNELNGRKLVLITTHRRENLGGKMHSALLGIRDALRGRDDLLAVLPVHPNPAVREVVGNVFCNIKNIKICEPLPMREFHTLLSLSHVVITDSGGIQEEAAYLGVPIFLLRDKTEREECKYLANVRIIGCEGESVKRELCSFFNDSDLQAKMCVRSSIFGDGESSKRIVRYLWDSAKEMKSEFSI